MRLNCLRVGLLLVMLALPARAAQPSLDDAWTRGMKARSEAANALAARIRTATQGAATRLVADDRSRALRRKVTTGAAIGAGLLLLVALARFWVAGQRRREDERLKNVLDLARRRDEERR